MMYDTKDELLDAIADYILGDGEKPVINNANSFLFRKIYTPDEVEMGLYSRAKHNKILHKIVMSGGYLHG